jgi:hypothetical protein
MLKELKTMRDNHKAGELLTKKAQRNNVNAQSLEGFLFKEPIN